MKSSNQTPIKPNVPKKYHTKVDVLKFIYENDNQEGVTLFFFSFISSF